jgi:rare lipoprotein A
MCVTLYILIIIPMQVKCETGYASYYTNAECGKITASQTVFDDRQYVCAMRNHRYGEHCLVAYQEHYVVCKIVDHGPRNRKRIIDLSKAAMKKLGGVRKGVIPVRVYLIGERR